MHLFEEKLGQLKTTQLAAKLTQRILNASENTPVSSSFPGSLLYRAYTASK